MADIFNEREVKDLFLKLTDAEEHHKKTLVNLYKHISGKEPGEAFPQDFISTGDLGDVMEGGMSVSEGVEWVKRHDIHEALELSVSLEVNSYDLYIKMSRSMKDEHARNVFKTLVTDEKYHLEKLAELLEKKL